MNNFESAVLTLLDDQVNNHSKPLSKDFFDRIERLKSKAGMRSMHELPFIVIDKNMERALGWQQASSWVSSLGSGWRLPTLEELDIIGNVCNDFEPEDYWSSVTQYSTMAWFRSFANGKWEYTGQSHTCYVRAIRDI